MNNPNKTDAFDAELTALGHDKLTLRFINHAIVSLRWLSPNIYSFETSRYESQDLVETLAMCGVQAVSFPVSMLPEKKQRKIKGPIYYFYRPSVSRADIVKNLKETVALNGGEWKSGYRVEIPRIPEALRTKALALKAKAPNA